MTELHNLNIFSGEDIGDFIVTALEGGSNYWIDHVVLDRSTCPKETSYYDVPMKGGKIVIAQCEEWVEGDIEVTLDKEAVDRGLEILRLKYPWHYRDLFKGDYDVIAADAWLQCAALGDIVYG
jgi:hypothetical protein